MTGPEVGLLSVVVALGSIIATSKVNGKNNKNNLTKDEHEVRCHDRLKPICDGIKTIQEDVKTLLLRK